MQRNWRVLAGNVQKNIYRAFKFSEFCAYQVASECLERDGKRPLQLV